MLLCGLFALFVCVRGWGVGAGWMLGRFRFEAEPTQARQDPVHVSKPAKEGEDPVFDPIFFN